MEFLPFPFVIDDDDALVAITAKLYRRLTENRCVPNPIDRNEDLNRIPDDAWDVFLVRLSVLYDAAQTAAGAADEVSAAIAWEGAFSFLMPFPETDEVEVVESSTERAVMNVPDIDISVYDCRGGVLLGTYRNEVPSVPRDRWLVFSIANRYIVPQYAGVSWTVRNDGDEASNIGDLGHVRHGIGSYSVEESTAYLGKHYMDCVIRLNGTVFAVRRVPVYIKPEEHAQRVQAQRSWMKLRTRRGRR